MGVGDEKDLECRVQCLTAKLDLAKVNQFYQLVDFCQISISSSVKWACKWISGALCEEKGRYCNRPVPEMLSMYPQMRAIIILTANTFNDNVTVTLHFQKTRSSSLRKEKTDTSWSPRALNNSQGETWTVERRQLLSGGRSPSPQEVTWMPQCL